VSGAALRANEIIAGKFRVERVVGAGGMGVVVAAHHLALDQPVAVKLMLPGVGARKPFTRRFLREARAAARLRSEHVTRVLDVGTLDDGTAYIVMELLEGHDLATLLRTRGPMSIGAAVALVLQGCDAIGEAHAAGIVHRDLKPANLFVTHRADGRPLVKLLDLGVCKLDASAGELHATSNNALIGTPTYMAPEQMRSAKEADARSDIWSLGVMLYELTTGRLPFPAATFAQLCLKVALDPCPALDVADAPPGFEAVVERCLAKDPSARFPTVAALAAALAPFAGPADLAELARDRLDPAVAVTMAEGEDRAAMAATALAALAPAALSPRRRRWRWRWRSIALATVLVAGLSVAGVELVQPRAGRTTGPAHSLTPVQPVPPASLPASAPPALPAPTATPVPASTDDAAKPPPPRRRPRGVPRPPAAPASPPPTAPVADGTDDASGLDPYASPD